MLCGFAHSLKSKVQHSVSRLTNLTNRKRREKITAKLSKMLPYKRTIKVGDVDVSQRISGPHLEHWQGPFRPYLADFRFNDLPQEIRLAIGEFTVQVDGVIFLNILARRPGSSGTGPNFKLSMDGNTLAMAHTCSKLHGPLIQHFFKVNAFNWGPILDYAFIWFEEKIQPHNTKLIRHMCMEYSSVRYIDREMTWLAPQVEAARIFGAARYADILTV